MTNLPSGTVNVSYNTETESTGIELSIALDEDKNREVYGENKSSFAPSERAYLKVITNSDIPYSLYSSAGTVTRSARNVPYDYSEDVSFVLTNSAELQHVPYGSVSSWEWYGRNAGQPLFSGKRVTISSPAVAVLHCEYRILGDQAHLLVLPGALIPYSEIEVVVAVQQGDTIASCTVNYGGSASTPQPVDLEVSDFCTDEVVTGVSVFLDGAYIGTTNSNGKIYLGMLMPGTTHQLLLTKEGYVDSDQDILHNDEFTVPSS